MPFETTLDLLTLRRDGVDDSQWPRLSCSQAQQAALAVGDLRLDAGREVLFQDQGQIRSFDDAHKLVFNRAGNLLELHEQGDIRFLTGGPPPTERLRIRANGQVGLGTATPTQALEVVGTVKATAFQGDGAGLTGVSATDVTKVAKTGDTMTGPLTITAGGLHVTGGADVVGSLHVSGGVLLDGNVGIGMSAPTQALDVVGTVKATAFQGNGTGLTGVSSTDATKVAEAGDTMSGALSITAAGTGLSVTNNAAVGGILTVGSNVGIGTTSPYATLTLSGSIGFTNGTTPMLYINQTGTSNPERPIIAHSPAFPNWGLSYRDVDDVMIFQSGGAAVMTVGLGTRSVTIPTGQLSFGAQTRQMINLWNTQYGIGVQSGTTYFRTDNHFAWFRGGSHNDTMSNPGAGGARLMALNVAGDLILSARTNPSANPSGSACRALVDGGNMLGINWDNDYPNGVEIRSNLRITGAAFKPGGGSWGNSSDIRLKQHVRPLAGALDKLLQLRGVCFEWKEPATQGNLTGPQMGMLAHEVEEVFPEWISTDPEGYKQLTVRGFEALVVEALRTLKAAQDQIEGQHQAFETRLGQLEATPQTELLVDNGHTSGAAR